MRLPDKIEAGEPAYKLSQAIHPHLVIISREANRCQIVRNLRAHLGPECLIPGPPGSWGYTVGIPNWEYWGSEFHFLRKEDAFWFKMRMSAHGNL